MVLLGVTSDAPNILAKGPVASEPAPVTPSPAPSAPIQAEPDAATALETSRAVWASRLGDAPPGPVPVSAYEVYTAAAEAMREADGRCELTWHLLAGAAWVESEHGELGTSRINPEGIATPPLFGARISPVDSDGGALDGTSSMDRTVGPFQFAPQVWRQVGVDADGNGRRDPQNLYDAALAYSVLLCNGKRDLGVRAQLAAALQNINTGVGYAEDVLAAIRYYRTHPDVVEEDTATLTPALQDPVLVLAEATPTATASSTPTPSATPSPTRNPTSSATPKPPPKATPKPTATSRPSATTTATATPSVTSSPTGSVRPSASN